MRRARSLSAAFAAGAALIAALAGPAGAQATGQARSESGAVRQGAQPANRLQLEREVRDRIHAMMRERMGLDEAQVARMDETLRTFEMRRRALLREERDARLTLRAAMGAGSGAGTGTAAARPDDARIAAALDTLILLQRRRIDLVEAEQRELATFLTPLQRAQFFALQENLRRVLEGAEVRPPRAGGARRPPDGRATPPR